MRYTVIGAARSGLAAAKLAKRLGHEVLLTEMKMEADLPNAADELHKHDIPHEFGGHSDDIYENTDEVIVSPGILPNAEIIRKFEERNIPIISELEFAWSQINNPTIAITGTNGKTTTTALTKFIINNSGKKAVAAGNIGTPLSALVSELDEDTIVVAEVSSFQLDRIRNFAPEVAVILNITPDHIGYHGSLDNYKKAKFKISSGQNEKNLLLLNADDPGTSEDIPETRAQILRFSMSPLDRGIYNEGGIMKIKLSQQLKVEEIMQFNEIGIPGIHNAYNSMAAALSARIFEIRNENIRDSLRAFSGVEHRLEKVRSIRGIDFINDSKATNINATWYALKSYDRPVVWIAGGRGDNNDYSFLDDPVRKNVKSIVAIGEEKDAIFNHFCTSVRCDIELSLEDAVKKAYDIAEDGDIVLFTPACKSFDMFMNYEHRGEVYKNIVNNLV